MVDRQLSASTPRSRLALLQALNKPARPAYGAVDAIAQAGDRFLQGLMAKKLMDQDLAAESAANNRTAAAYAQLLGPGQQQAQGVQQFPSGAPVQSAQPSPMGGAPTNEALVRALQASPQDAPGLINAYSSLQKQNTPETFGDFQSVMGPDNKPMLIRGGNRGSIKTVEGYTPAPKEDNVTVEIADPTSPTGKRIVSRADAIGKPGPAGSQMRLVTNPDGTMTFEQGTGLGPNSIQKTTANQLEKEIIGLQGNYAQALKMASSIDDSMLQLPTKVQQGWNALREKSGIDALALSPDEQSSLGNYTKARQDAYRYFNDTIKEMSGASVTDGEAERQIKVIPNPDQDGPTEYKAKVQGTLDFMENALARKQYALKNGVDWKTIPLGNMDKIMEDRADQIYQLAKRGGADDETAKKRAIEATRVEFGLMR